MTTSTRAKQNPTVTTSTAQGLSDMGFSAAEIKRVRRGWVTCRTSACSYFLDGTTPTSTYGHTFAEGATYEIREGMAGLEIIAESASATVTVEIETAV